MENIWSIIFVLLIFFAIALVICTIVGALILWISTEVYSVGNWSWWNAFVIGFTLALSSSFIKINVSSD